MTATNFSSEQLFNFPCEYPIKIFGKTCDALQNTTCSIVEKHTDKLHPNQISVKKSTKGNYTSLTIRIIASGKAQLDAINQDLQNCPLVAYVL